MYIRITDKCNMKCAHCCFSCGPRGQNMTRETFIAACKLAKSLGEYIFLGGGEPTVHPLFWDFVGIALKYNDGDLNVSLVTNGKKTEDAMALADLARRGILGVALSQDEYHEPISEKVVAAFRRNPYSGSPFGCSNNDPHDCREIRTVTHIIAHGRGKNISGAENRCCCDELIIQPDGRIFCCACPDAPQFGTVDAPAIPDDYLSSECWKHQPQTVTLVTQAA